LFPIIRPNLHPILVHFPLALLNTGLVIEIFSFLGWRRSPIRAAGRWMILIGALATVPAALSGIYALHDVAMRGLDADSQGLIWHDTATQSPLVLDRGAWDHLCDHTTAEAIASGLALLAVVLWIGSSDEWRRWLHLLILLMLVAAAGIAGYGADLAGKAVYVNGVGVESLVTPTPHAGRGAAPATAPSTSGAAAAVMRALPSENPMPTFPGQRAVVANARDIRLQFEQAFPPLQNHVIFAGLMLALAALSVGLTLRASHAPAPGHNVSQIAAAFGAVSGGSRDVFDESAGRTPAPPSPVVNDPAAIDLEVRNAVPSARFWLLTFLAAAITLVLGWWVLAADAETFDVKRLWDLVFDLPIQNIGHLTRRQAHVICGSAIVILPLLLAVLARLAPRRKLLLLPVALLLTAAIAAQIWLGILMMFDTNSGPVTHFTPADQTARP
jgi:uncharacterized membrane protein